MGQFNRNQVVVAVLALISGLVSELRLRLRSGFRRFLAGNGFVEQGFSWKMSEM